VLDERLVVAPPPFGRQDDANTAPVAWDGLSADAHRDVSVGFTMERPDTPAATRPFKREGTSSQAFDEALRRSVTPAINGPDLHYVSGHYS
jgi:hypothetical protein